MADIKAIIYLKDGTQAEFGKRYIRSLESLSQSNPDPSSIFYGVLSSTGTIEILDINGRIESYVKNGQLDASSTIVDLYANNKLIHRHISTDNNYSSTEKILSLQLTDRLSKWDNINFNGYTYPEKSQTAYEMLKTILTSVGYDENYIDNTMLSEYTLDTNNRLATVKDYLNSINIEYPYLPQDTLHATIDKFCTLAQLNVILDNNDDIKFIAARPIINTSDDTIKIPKNNQYSKLNYTLIVKNNYDGIELNEFNVTSNEVSTENVFSYTKQLDENNYNYTNSYFDYAKSGNTFSDVKIETFYSNEFDFDIPKLSDNNLKKILAITSSQTSQDAQVKANVNVSGEYGVYKGNYTQNLLDDTIPGDNTSYFAQNPYYDNIEFNETPYRITSKPLTKLESWFEIVDKLPNVEIADNSYVNISDDGEYYHCNAKLLNMTIGYLVMYEPSASFFNSDIDKYKTNNLVITFSGVVRQIEFNSQTASSDNINSAKNPISIETSELFEQVSIINNERIVNVLKQNILSDYSDGISDATLTVSCANYYDENGDRVIDFEKGDLLKVGDIVNVEGNENLWKITGRRFRYNGCPFVDLELMEVKDTIHQTTINIDSSLSSYNGTALQLYYSNTDAKVSWGDGSETAFPFSEVDTTNRASHVYTSPFEGNIIISKGVNFKFDTASLADFAKTAKSVYFDTSLTYLVEGTCSGCSNLEKVALPNNITEIPRIAFSGCNSLTSIYIPSNVTSIGERAFGNCSNLTSVNIPNNMENVGSYAFYYCTGLTNIEIPIDVTSIGRYAFAGCNKLSQITLKGSVPPVIQADTFDINYVETIYIPRGSLEAYQNATNWAQFSEKFIEID